MKIMAIYGIEPNKKDPGLKNALLQDEDIPVAPIIPVPREDDPKDKIHFTPVFVPVPIFPRTILADVDLEIVFDDSMLNSACEAPEEIYEEAMDQPVEGALSVGEDESPVAEEIVEEPDNALLDQPAEESIGAFTEESPVLGEGVPLSVDEIVEKIASVEEVEYPTVDEPLNEEADAVEEAEINAILPDASEEKHGNNFIDFKKRLNLIRTIRAALVGSAAGFASAGVWLVLYKLAIINLHPIMTLLVGLGACLICGGLTYLLTAKKDKKFAEELDSAFDLKARVQTMIAYREEGGGMISIQRQDAENALSQIPLKSYKFKKLWIYITSLVLATVILVSGFVVADVRRAPEVEQIIPYELSALQENGLNELIRHVENSGMEDEFKTRISEELKNLLITLRSTKTQDKMLTVVQSCMAAICEITYESSTETEVLNALWESDDIYFKHLAVALDTSNWSAPDWGDFAEKIVKYEGVLMGDDKNEKDSYDNKTAKDTLKFALDTMSRKLDITLGAANLPEDDEIILAIKNLFKRNPGGFAPLLASLDYIDEATAREQLTLCFNLNSESLYNAISLNRTNAAEGEYVMLRLSGLFIIPLPDFERPDFVKNGETVGGDSSGGDKDENNNQNAGGGLGTGATFGSNDLVLDPMTGELVPLGDLLARYYTIMYGKLEGDSYTEEQKEAIKKYFSLLYGSAQKQEGN